MASPEQEKTIHEMLQEEKARIGFFSSRTMYLCVLLAYASLFFLIGRAHLNALIIFTFILPYITYGIFSGFGFRNHRNVKDLSLSYDMPSLKPQVHDPLRDGPRNHTVLDVQSGWKSGFLAKRHHSPFYVYFNTIHIITFIVFMFAEVITPSVADTLPYLIISGALALFVTALFAAYVRDFYEATVISSYIAILPLFLSSLMPLMLYFFHAPTPF